MLLSVSAAFDAINLFSPRRFIPRFISGKLDKLDEMRVLSNSLRHDHIVNRRRGEHPRNTGQSPARPCWLPETVLVQSGHVNVTFREQMHSLFTINQAMIHGIMCLSKRRVHVKARSHIECAVVAYVVC